ncbi:unnamed protein product [Sphagnum jensenii]|uniref:ATP-dependent RNA helicase n=1 Tax=Sphagnum jensenii TaxID=128206 RepID=A0ABP1B6V4_9BRYO
MKKRKLLDARAMSRGGEKNAREEEGNDGEGGTRMIQEDPRPDDNNHQQEVILPEAMKGASVPETGVVVANTKGPPVLPWMRSPIEIGILDSQPVAQIPCLDPRLKEALQSAAIDVLFPVQVAVWQQVMGPGGGDRDICVSSPTGSGKTLSYALPIVQMLSTRVLRRLRALVVLPTRDLAMQVKAVFDMIAPAVGLSVGLAVGQTSIAAEAAELVEVSKKMVHSFGTLEHCQKANVASRVDILVATPGRLMDHFRSTPGFTIGDLQYLVVDETDRLLRQAYQDWLPNVLQVIQAPPVHEVANSAIKGSLKLGSVLTRRKWCLEQGMKGRVHPRVLKMVLSATLTRHPAKIAQLDLYCPTYIAPSADGNRYQLPKGLQTFRLVCRAREKLLFLVALLQQFRDQRTIVFTASVEATHRLFLLLRCFYNDEAHVVAEYSSKGSETVRRKALEEFRRGTVHVMVASDALTRGMDVEGIANVVNYDVPVYVKTYVHRVGRTARAGQAGRAFTLMVRKEARHFKMELLSKLENGICKDYELPASLIDVILPRFTAAHKRFEEEAPGKDIDILISEGRDLTARSTIPETAQTEQSVI